MSCFMESGADSNSCVVRCGLFKTPRPWPESIDSSLLYKSKNTGLFMWGNEHNVLRKRCLGHPYTNKVVLVKYPVCFMSSCDMYMSSLTLKHKTVEFKVVKRHGQAGLFCQHTQVWLESLTVYLLYCIEDSMPFAWVQLDFEVKNRSM